MTNKNTKKYKNTKLTKIQKCYRLVKSGCYHLMKKYIKKKESRKAITLRNKFPYSKMKPQLGNKEFPKIYKRIKIYKINIQKMTES